MNEFLTQLVVQLPTLGFELLIGFVLGMLISFFGVGGGFITVAILHVVLGVPVAILVGTSNVQITLTSAIQSFKMRAQIKQAKFIILCIALGLPIGVWLGTQLLYLMRNSNHQLLIVYSIMLSLIILWMLYSNFILTPEKRQKLRPLFDRLPQAKRYQFWPLFFLGVFSGFLSGLMGIGGGIVLIPALIYLVGMPISSAIVISTFLIVIASFLASIVQIIHHNVRFDLALILFLGSFFGGIVGRRVSKNISSVKLEKAFIFVVILTLALVVRELF